MRKKAIICIALCLALALLLCGCGILSGRYDGYDAKTLYCADGYEPRYAYQLMRKELYARTEFFGMPLFEYNENSHTFYNPDGVLTDITFEEEHEVRKKFIKLLPEEQRQSVEELKEFILITLPNATYGVFYGERYYDGDANDPYRPPTLNGSKTKYWYYSMRMYKYVDSDTAIVYRTFDAPYTETNMMCVALKDNRFCFNGYVWLDYDLNSVNAVLDVDNSKKYELSDVQSMMQDCNIESVSEKADDISGITMYKSIGGINYFVLHGTSGNTYILETDSDHNVKRLAELGMKTNRAYLREMQKKGKNYKYYFIDGEYYYYS